jgi:hypothetical protein
VKQGAFGLALKAAAGLALFAAGWFGGWMTAGNAQAQALRDYCLKVIAHLPPAGVSRSQGWR